MLNLSPLSLRQLPAKQGGQTFNPSPKSAALFPNLQRYPPPLQALLSQVLREYVRRYITREAAQVF